MSKLIGIAAEMKREARANLGQPVRRQLKGGLHLVLLQTIRQSQLSLIRDGVTPSPKEVEVIRRDFEVPAAARLERDQKLTQGRSFYIVRLIWPQTNQLTLFAEEDNRVVMTWKGQSTL